MQEAGLAAPLLGGVCTLLEGDAVESMVGAALLGACADWWISSAPAPFAEQAQSCCRVLAQGCHLPAAGISGSGRRRAYSQMRNAVAKAT